MHVPLSAWRRWAAVKQKTDPGLKFRAMRYLARREYSRAELRARLLPHVQEGEDIDAVLDELARRNWLSDERAAEQLLNQRRGRYGAQRIVHEFRQRGIADDLIDALLPQLRQGELEAAREVWRKKFASAPRDAKEKARQARFLQARGFSMEVVLKVLKLAGQPGDEEF